MILFNTLCIVYSSTGNGAKKDEYTKILSVS
nr:MAG TPA: hypothetical protein [Caudoviricetes sp.]